MWPGLKIHSIPAEAFCCCASGSSSGFDSAAFMIPPHYYTIFFRFFGVFDIAVRVHTTWAAFCVVEFRFSLFLPSSSLLCRSSIHRTLETRKICSAHCCGHLNLFFLLFTHRKGDFTTLLRRHAIGAGVSSEKNLLLFKEPESWTSAEEEETTRGTKGMMKKMKNDNYCLLKHNRLVSSL